VVFVCLVLLSASVLYFLAYIAGAAATRIRLGLANAELSFQRQDVQDESLLPLSDIGLLWDIVRRKFLKRLPLSTVLVSISLFLLLQKCSYITHSLQQTKHSPE